MTLPPSQEPVLPTPATPASSDALAATATRISPPTSSKASSSYSPSSHEAPLLRIAGLTLHRRQRDGGKHAVLRDVSMSMNAGELVMLIGPNGAGKSTLLSAVAGDLTPSIGQIELDGRPLGDWRRQVLAQRRAVLPQRAGLSLPFSVNEVIRLGCLARTGGQSTLDRIVADAALAAGVDQLADRSMTQLSGGEQARVHLARVLAQVWPEGSSNASSNAESNASSSAASNAASNASSNAAPQPSSSTRNLLLLDEPCASLDPHHQHAVCTLVRDFAHRTGCGVVITMHDMNLAGQYGDRVVALLDGAVAADGPPQDVLTRDFVQRCFAVDAARLDIGNGLLVATRPWTGA